MKRAVVIGLLVVAVVLAACTSAKPGTAPATSDTARTSASPTSAPVRTSVPAPVFRPAHTVVVVMENHSYSDVIGNPDAPYINSLGTSGALFTQSFAVTHPSEPNYLALFSGSTQGVTDDSCPHTFSAPDLGTAMRAAGHSFAGYSESLPATGFTGCSSGSYARKHAPWIDFSALPASVNVPFSAFPTDYAALPTLSVVIPNLDNDMHDGTVAQGDQWLQANLGGYVTWAQAHRSVLVLTWDEDDRSAENQIPTIIVGSHVTAGRYSEHVTHYRLLRTLEYLYDLAPIGASADTPPVTDIWQQ
jgi:phosphatidylinositol-3-phosphatase